MAVLEVVMNVPVDLAAWVHPRLVHMASGHCVANRPLSASAQRVVADPIRNRGQNAQGTAAEKAAG